jgi:ATP-dependent Lon protease
VPTDFILVAACNIEDLQYILSPLRSRIVGNGYEILMEDAMPDNKENRLKYLHFISHEINIECKITHMEIEATDLIIEEGKRKAKENHKNNALTLRLRELGGLIRASGDMAIEKNHKLIEKPDVKDALELYVPVEEKIKKYYGSMHNALGEESTGSQKGEYNSYYNYNDDRSYK